MEGFSFVKWIGEGPLDSNSSTTQIYLDQDLNPTALFSLNSHHLQIEMEGNGTPADRESIRMEPWLKLLLFQIMDTPFKSGKGVMNPLRLRLFKSTAIEHWKPSLKE